MFELYNIVINNKIHRSSREVWKVCDPKSPHAGNLLGRWISFFINQARNFGKTSGNLWSYLDSWEKEEFEILWFLVSHVMLLCPSKKIWAGTANGLSIN